MKTPNPNPAFAFSGVDEMVINKPDEYGHMRLVFKYKGVRVATVSILERGVSITDENTLPFDDLADLDQNLPESLRRQAD